MTAMTTNYEQLKRKSGKIMRKNGILETGL
jgi:hypothetical protein